MRPLMGSHEIAAVLERRLVPAQATRGWLTVQARSVRRADPSRFTRLFRQARALLAVRARPFRVARPSAWSGDYRPLNSGRRFSMKAVTPSARSSVAKRR
jgi:hypothetical protein